jgi:ABC-type transporter Mla MlaB component
MSIKISRALRKSAIGSCHRSSFAMLDAIPVEVVTKCDSSTLALLLDAMWSACQASKAIAASDIINEGAVWEARHQRLVEIVV